MKSDAGGEILAVWKTGPEEMVFDATELPAGRTIAEIHPMQTSPETEKPLPGATKIELSESVTFLVLADTP